MSVFQDFDDKRRGISLLGSTGSIGTQALEVIARHPTKLKVVSLSANDRWEALAAQARKFMPDAVVICNEKYYLPLKEALSDLPIKVYAGHASLSHIVASDEVDMVLSAMVGISGLLPTIAAIEAHKHIALANKETLVVAGELITKLCAEHRVQMLPVDSEHSAIFQCLTGENLSDVHKLILTASGGPFRGFTAEQLAGVTREQALKHPNWEMGAKITIDSATLMNKGLEVIEAHWLFGIPAERIDVVVHPQSIVHSLVHFNDGSLKAQIGGPDMRVPIQFALCYPERPANNFNGFSLLDKPNLSFESVDTQNFPCLTLCYEALSRGGTAPAILNGANEVANAAFRAGLINFAAISAAVAACLNKVNVVDQPDLSAFLDADKQAREYCGEYLDIKAAQLH